MADVTILWTGGWDSTFRILDLLVNHKATVKPFYLVDNDRAAAQLEIETMGKIRLQVEQEFPFTEGRLAPLEVFSRDDVPADPAISGAYRSLVARQHVGSQYDWLARFCAAKGISDIELSIDKDIKQRSVLTGARAALANAAVAVETDYGVTYRLDPAQSESDGYKVFRYFTFPLFNTTKIEMGEKAKASGFFHILEGSWFCHFPINSQACGRCPPCRATIEKGMGHRLPAISRYIRYPLRKVEKKITLSLPESAVSKLKRIKAALS
jgi:hypothetical protein